MSKNLAEEIFIRAVSRDVRLGTNAYKEIAQNSLLAAETFRQERLKKDKERLSSHPTPKKPKKYSRG